ncbi:MAG: DUF4402 domain-containing protein [Pseudomonadota bacterium]
MKIKSTLAAAMVIASLPAAADTASSNNGAVIIGPLQVSNTQALYFGTIAPSVSASGTANLVPSASAATRTCSAELACLTNDFTQAEFTVIGDIDRVVTYDVPANVSVSNGSTGNMTIALAGESAINGTRVLTGGISRLNFGGTLSVAANQPPGDYTGQFTLTVEYQ